MFVVLALEASLEGEIDLEREGDEGDRLRQKTLEWTGSVILRATFWILTLFVVDEVVSPFLWRQML